MKSNQGFFLIILLWQILPVGLVKAESLVATTNFSDPKYFSFSEEEIQVLPVSLSWTTKLPLVLKKSQFSQLNSKAIAYWQADNFSSILLSIQISTKASDLNFIPEESAELSLKNFFPLQTAQSADENQVFSQETPEATSGTSDLAQQSQNPIANLISVPFQNNFNFNVGENEDLQYVLNIQPVIPTSLNADLLLVTRTIVPLISQPTIEVNTTTGEIKSDSTFGLGDINPQFFFVPDTDSNLTWGLGPVFLLPTATDEVLGTGKWGIGPTGVIVLTRGNWLIGVLANQVWSFAGDSERQEVSQFLIQPFVNYSLPDGWTIGSAPTITANWNADEDDKWTVPVGLSLSKLFTIGTQPATLALGGFYNVESPTFGPDWTLRLQFTLLYPR
ncbi:MAG TPA: neuromedin U [Xenococcaceae cyanobacterium]